MKEVYLTEDEIEYNCPYCGTEIINYGDIENMDTEYCGNCFKEIRLIIIDK